MHDVGHRVPGAKYAKESVENNLHIKSEKHHEILVRL